MMGAMIMLLVLVAWDAQEQVLNPTDEMMPILSVEEAEELRVKIDAGIAEADWFTNNFTLARQRADAAVRGCQPSHSLQR